jgi:hypothetical protein
MATRFACALGVLALAGAVACSALVDTSGLTGSVGAPRDAAADRSGIDATLDAPGALDGAAGDTGPQPIDGGAEGGYCATLAPPPTFCDDFDNVGTPLTDRWTGQFATRDGGSVTRDTSLSRSPPASLRARLAGAQATCESGLYKQFPGAPSRVVSRFALFIDELPNPGDSAEIGTVAFELSAQDGWQVYLAIESTGSATIVHQRCNPSCGTQIPLGTTSLAARRWYDVAFDVTTSPARATVTVDGAPVAQGASLTAANGTGTLLVAAGISWASGSACDVDVHVDDVAVTVTP